MATDSTDPTLGTVRFIADTSDGATACVLHLLGSRRFVWEVPPPGDGRLVFDPILASIATAPHGPADGFYGPKQLESAAELFGGTWDAVERPMPPEGTVY